ncbi:MAG: hypothetical protein E7A34_00260 [Leclercia adecarboxylata]|nr:hypothetical protein [Leclercia adecarboxylata]MDU1082806.1 hypothetical protein [Leclercia adecarboxylata]
MNGIRIIVPADTEIDVVYSMIAAAWNAGATRVSVERAIPVTVDMSVSIEGFVCDGREECNECEITLCSTACQEVKRQRNVAALVAQYDKQEAALLKTADELRRVAHARH